MKKLFILLMLCVIPLIGQNVRTSRVTAGSTYGAVIKLTDKEIPLAVYMDSINTITTISFYVLVGDSAGIGTDSSKYMPLTLVGDTTAYSIPLTRLKYVPLNSSLFYSLFPNPNSPGNTNGTIYLLPKLGVVQSLTKVIKIRVGIGAMPTANDLTLTTGSTSSLTNYSHPPTHFLLTAGTDTVGGSTATSWVDTLTSTSDYYQTYSIIPDDDTLQISIVSGLFTTATVIMAGEPFNVTVDPLLNPKLYIRRYGTAGTVTYRIYGGGY